MYFSDAFATVLGGGFDGLCTTGTLHGNFPEGFPTESDGRGYDSDSDLDDDDACDDEEQAVKSVTSEFPDISGSGSSLESLVTVNTTNSAKEKVRTMS